MHTSSKKRNNIGPLRLPTLTWAPQAFMRIADISSATL
ncbi:unnamed protein product [Ixodes pacificus]